LRKHRSIRKALGVSVPVPVDSDAVVEAIFEGLLLRGKNPSADQMSLFDDLVEKRSLDAQWDAAVEREKRSRTVFSHEGIKPEEVAREVEAMRYALGGASEVEAFVRDALAALDVPISPATPARIELGSLPTAIQEPLRLALPAADWKSGALRARFDTANAAGETLLGRTHPLVSVLAAHVLETALDPLSVPQKSSTLAARCGAMRTDAVKERTTLLLLRMRFHLHRRARGGEERALLAEDCSLVAFRGAPDAAQWLPDAEAEALLQAAPVGNIAPDQAGDFVRRALDGYDHLLPELEAATTRRGEELMQAHHRVREAAKSGGSTRVDPQLPPDVLGVWVLLPPL
jgi:hypothetical protein